MARRRPAKRRKGTKQPPVLRKDCQTKETTPTPHDSRPTSSAQQSSDDGTMSEQPTTASARTPMTSFIDTDEEMSLERANNTATTSEPDSDEEDRDHNAVSLYPASHYPQMQSHHRSEQPYLGAEGRHEGSDMGASTRSLWEQDLDYREIHGRRYCRDYFMPNDDIEQLRLHLLHQVFLHVLDGELTTVQLDDPMQILDVGTGTGEWPIRMAEMYSDCEVVGTDISAIAETQSVPLNVFFEIEDARDWDRQADFYDLIHFRLMDGAFTNWTSVYDNVYYSLQPGGWIEVQDFDLGASGLAKFFSQFPPESRAHELQRDFLVASEMAGRSRCLAHMNPRILMDAGFVDVRATEYVIPITIAEKSIGKVWLIACLDALEATYLRLLTEYMDWDPDDCKAACEDAARELAELAKDPEKSKELQVKLVILAARKPVDAPLAKTPQLPPTEAPSMGSEEALDALESAEKDDDQAASISELAKPE